MYSTGRCERPATVDQSEPAPWRATTWCRCPDRTFSRTSQLFTCQGFSQPGWLDPASAGGVRGAESVDGAKGQSSTRVKKVANSVPLPSRRPPPAACPSFPGRFSTDTHSITTAWPRSFQANTAIHPPSILPTRPRTSACPSVILSKTKHVPPARSRRCSVTLDRCALPAIPFRPRHPRPPLQCSLARFAGRLDLCHPSRRPLPQAAAAGRRSPNRPALPRPPPRPLPPPRPPGPPAPPPPALAD